MHEVIATLWHVFIDLILVGVIWKCIIAHALADLFMNHAKAWVARSPDRQAYFDVLLAQFKKKQSS